MIGITQEQYNNLKAGDRIKIFGMPSIITVVGVLNGVVWGDSPTSSRTAYVRTVNEISEIVAPPPHPVEWCNRYTNGAFGNWYTSRQRADEAAFQYESTTHKRTGIVVIYSDDSVVLEPVS